MMWSLFLAIASQTPAATALVRSHGAGIVAIEVVEVNSSAKAASGSGFFATEAGHIITNYHVVSQAILEPSQHRVSVIPHLGSRVEGRVIAIDVVNDLALVQTSIAPETVLRISPDTP